jgi:hypothetical protein
MHNRLAKFAERREGGMLSIVAGSLWQVIEAAHNWTYICELAHISASFARQANSFIHPPL